MSRYIEILAVQRPFPFNTDENERTMFSVNFEAMAEAPVDQWEEEIAKIIENAALGTRGTDIFIGPVAQVPVGDGPYIGLLDTGGSEPEYIHNNNGTTYERLSMQIVVRAKLYRTARTRALAVWRALNGTRNTTVAA